MNSIFYYINGCDTNEEKHIDFVKTNTTRDNIKKMTNATKKKYNKK